MDSPKAERNWPVIGGVALLGLACVVLIVTAVVFLGGGPNLEQVAEDCADSGQPSIGDNGETLTVKSDGSELSALGASAVSACVLVALEAPDSVISKVEGTTSMMGRQTDSWDDLELTWTYRPDNGLEIIVEAG